MTLRETVTSRGAWWRGIKSFMATCTQVAAFLGLIAIPASWLWTAAVAQVDEKYRQYVIDIVTPEIRALQDSIESQNTKLDTLLNQYAAERRQSQGEASGLKRVECLLELQANPQLDPRNVASCDIFNGDDH